MKEFGLYRQMKPSHMFFLLVETATFGLLTSGKEWHFAQNRNAFCSNDWSFRNVERRALICKETAPVLRMILTPDNNGLWVSTTESNVRYWNISGLDYHSFTEHSSKSATSSGNLEPIPEVRKADFVISGGPSIKQYEILNDRRHILTKDTENNVALYDVLKAKKVEDLHQVDFEHEVKNRFQVSRQYYLLYKLLNFYMQTSKPFSDGVRSQLVPGGPQDWHAHNSSWSRGK